MAKADQKSQNEIATQEEKTTAIATTDVMDFAADAGAGMEGATAESFAIPFIMVLQKGSPQVDETLGAAIEGAKAGMLYDNISGRMYEGKKGLVIVPCHFRRVFLRWGPKGGQGSGFRGELLPEQVAMMRAKGQIVELENRLYVPLPDGSVNEKTCDRIADVRNHYVLAVDEESGWWTQALISLGSTQIKKSKTLMSALSQVRVPAAGGGMVQPATYASQVRVTTLPESNEKGSWYGVKFEVLGRVANSAMYAAGKAFHQAVLKGSVEAKYEEDGVDGAAPAGGGEADNRI